MTDPTDALRLLRDLIEKFRDKARALRHDADWMDGCNDRERNPEKRQELWRRADERFTCADELEAAVLPLLDRNEDDGSRVETGATIPPAESTAKSAVGDALTLREVAEASLSRANRWHTGGLTDWSPLEWAGAMAGEAGEACNAAKKYKRVTDQIAHHDNRQFGQEKSLPEQADGYRLDVAKEAADTVLYAFCLCARVGLDLAPVLIDVFNKKSEEYGFPERVGLRALEPQEPDTAGAGERLRVVLELDGPEPPLKRVAAFLRQDALMQRTPPNHRWDVPETMARAYEHAADLIDATAR